MPIYEYVCSKCEKTNDAMQKVSDPIPQACPSCGAEGTLTRVVSRTSFVLKGGGWYSDLYGSTKKGDAATPSKADGGASTASSGASSAPASTSSTPASTSSPSTASSSSSSSTTPSSGGGGSSDGSAKKAANA